MSKTRTSCTAQRHEVRQADLPISCPMPNDSGWDGHPRVFLELKDGETRCPYCGTTYVLVDDNA